MTAPTLTDVLLNALQDAQVVGNCNIVASPYGNAIVLGGYNDVVIALDTFAAAVLKAIHNLPCDVAQPEARKQIDRLYVELRERGDKITELEEKLAEQQSGNGFELLFELKEQITTLNERIAQLVADDEWNNMALGDCHSYIHFLEGNGGADPTKEECATIGKSLKTTIKEQAAQIKELEAKLAAANASLEEYASNMFTLAVRHADSLGPFSSEEETKEAIEQLEGEYRGVEFWPRWNDLIDENDPNVWSIAYSWVVVDSEDDQLSDACSEDE